MNPIIEFNGGKNVFIAGEIVKIKIVQSDGNDTVNLNISKVGEKNPSFKYGASANISDGNAFVNIKTENFEQGFYEIKHISSLLNANYGPENLINYFSEENFIRFPFKILPVPMLTGGVEDVLGQLIKVENDLEQDFLKGIYLTQPSKKSFTVFVFLNGVIISRKMRFEQFEILPFRGKGDKELIGLVNEFLSECTSLKISFNYSEELKDTISNDNPFCVVHFPYIFCNDEQEAYKYTVEESSILSEVISAHRGSLASVVSTIIYDNELKTSSMFTVRTPYRGNLLRGEIAGEDPFSIESILRGIKGNSLKRYFLSIYKEAVSERNIDFAYLRYWQLLETIAETKKFQTDEILHDFNGRPISHPDGSEVRLNTSRSKVYELIKQHRIGEKPLCPPQSLNDQTVTPTNLDLWTLVKLWLSMRNAAGHFGGFVYGDKFLKENFRDYSSCKKLFLAQGNNKYGYIFDYLKNTSWLILRNELSAP
ncbi:methylamine utilization protein MauJ [Syntrophotalea acetylenica]|uniref:Uncharacterized protein n=1 Tax=Syntrophotalea acetylenica TaxID=29542 RepID=A0A1L3GJ90_SYNAC|nr:methylamine utilization protein MauJ [Syntrophotalea acetylenica]APG25950.1 hypothetical protein A7E75_13750 [Syntrophotalea acetylenica]